MAGAPLFSAKKCALVVIDVQDYFLAKASPRLEKAARRAHSLAHAGGQHS